MEILPSLVFLVPFLAKMPFFIAKMPILGISVRLSVLNYGKLNRNVGIPIKMRGQPASYDQPFPKYAMFAIFGILVPFFSQNAYFMHFY